MPLTSDDSAWPILVCRAIGESTDEDIEQYLALLSTKLRRQQRHVLIVDATEGRKMKVTHRRIVAEWNKKNAQSLSQHRAGLVLIARSPIQRGILTAIYWIFSPPFPYSVTDNMERAKTWALAQLNNTPT